MKNFQPVGEFELPEYELQRLSFPPLLLIMEHLARENYSELIISTPGPVGLCALCAAKTLGLRAVGIYHTDFPQYVRILTDDSFLETLTWNYMHWFYSQLDVVYVNSQDYRRSWIERGIPAEKLKILPRGMDTRIFNPSRRDAQFWRAKGLRDGEIGMLFVGTHLEGEEPGHAGSFDTPTSELEVACAPALRWRRAISVRDEAPSPGRAFHGLPAG